MKEPTLIKMQFDPDVAKIAGTDEAIILSNIEYWVMKNRANNKSYHDGRYWTYNSASAFQKMFNYLSEHQIRRALKKLENLGFIVVGEYNKSKYDRTRWYSLGNSSPLHDLAKSQDEANEITRPIPDNKPDNYLQVNNIPSGLRGRKFGNPKQQGLKNALDEAGIYYPNGVTTAGKLNKLLKNAEKLADKSKGESDYVKAIELIRKSAQIAGKKSPDGLNQPVVSSIDDLLKKLKSVNNAKVSKSDKEFKIRESVRAFDDEGNRIDDYSRS